MMLGFRERGIQKEVCLVLWVQRERKRECEIERDGIQGFRLRERLRVKGLESGSNINIEIGGEEFRERERYLRLWV